MMKPCIFGGNMISRTKKPVRNFFWPVQDQRTKDALDLFVKLSVVRGTSHFEVLTELVVRYNESFLDENAYLKDMFLVDEKTLMEKLRAQGTPISRVFLSRNRDSLRSEVTTLFWTDGRRVVYNLSACKEFFSRLKKAA